MSLRSAMTWCLCISLSVLHPSMRRACRLFEISPTFGGLFMPSCCSLPNVQPKLPDFRAGKHTVLHVDRGAVACHKCNHLV